jgi:hypothetical protein
MGRPLSRRMFGPINTDNAPDLNTPPSKDGEDQHGNDLTGNVQEYRQGFNIPVNGARIIGGAPDEGGDGSPTPFILAQRAARRFIVRTGDGDGTCKLVDGESALNEGEMFLKGYLDGAGDGVAIRKISGRKAYDFDSNAYTWYVGVKAGEDSTVGNTIILNAV